MYRTTDNLPRVTILSEKASGRWFGFLLFRNLIRLIRNQPWMFFSWFSLTLFGLWIFWLTSLKETEAFWLDNGNESKMLPLRVWQPLILNAYYGILWMHIWLTGSWLVHFLRSSEKGKAPSSNAVWLSWFLVFLLAWNGLSLASDNILEWVVDSQLD